MVHMPRPCASATRSRIRGGQLAPGQFRELLETVPWPERDTWVDAVLGLDEIMPDGPDLPRGCAPYLPCAVDALLRAVDIACIKPGEVVVDVGSGAGRAALLIHLLTGASVVGIEVQRSLVRASRKHAHDLCISGFSAVEGEAGALGRYMVNGSVFFLYCPFSGKRLHDFVDSLEQIARTRFVRLCAVDITLPERAWLARVTHESPDISACVSQFPLCTQSSQTGTQSPSTTRPPRSSPRISAIS